MDVATVLPAGGVAAVLALVIFYLLNSNRLDRQQHREERTELRESLRTMRTDHDEQIKSLNARVDSLEAELENERTQRYAAVADAAAERLRAERAEMQLAVLRMGDRDDSRGA